MLKCKHLCFLVLLKQQGNTIIWLKQQTAVSLFIIIFVWCIMVTLHLCFIICRIGLVLTCATLINFIGAQQQQPRSSSLNHDSHTTCLPQSLLSGDKNDSEAVDSEPATGLDCGIHCSCCCCCSCSCHCCLLFLIVAVLDVVTKEGTPQKQ